MKKDKKSFKGFTLIELLVVIAIIGLLSSIVLASLNTARVKARDASRISSLLEIQKAIELYYNNTGSMPGNKALAQCCVYYDTNSDFLSELVSSNIFSVVPTDPINHFWYYNYVGACGYFVAATLEGDSSKNPDYSNLNSSGGGCGTASSCKPGGSYCVHGNAN